MMIRHLTAPMRSIVQFPLFQVAVVIFVILWLQAADDKSVLGQIFSGLDNLVDATVRSVAAVFNIRAFTKSWLTTGFWIAYVYLVCLLILALARRVIRLALDLIGRRNVFWLRNAIARERGIAAYRAWEPFERIRPTHIPQPEWEEKFAWPADNKPPYLPLAQRLLRGVIGCLVVIGGIAAVLQVFTSFPVLTWFGRLAKLLFS
jgi:hypothetical protein